jgi:hypothetical protein
MIGKSEETQMLNTKEGLGEVAIDMNEPVTITVSNENTQKTVKRHFILDQPVEINDGKLRRTYIPHAYDSKKLGTITDDYLMSVFKKHNTENPNIRISANFMYDEETQKANGII